MTNNVGTDGYSAPKAPVLSTYTSPAPGLPPATKPPGEKAFIAQFFFLNQDERYNL